MNNPIKYILHMIPNVNEQEELYIDDCSNMEDEYISDVIDYDISASPNDFNINTILMVLFKK